MDKKFKDWSIEFKVFYWRYINGTVINNSDPIGRTLLVGGSARLSKKSVYESYYSPGY